MTDAEMRRWGNALFLGALSVLSVSSCGGEASTDVNEDVASGGKSASTGGTGPTGGVGAGGTTSGGSATGGAKATGGSATGGTKATGGGAPVSGGSASGGVASGSGGAGANVEPPDDSCLEGCELASEALLCGEERFTWVCFDPDEAASRTFDSPECEPAATQVPRYCCSADFRPCE